MRNLILVFGDQLNIDSTVFDDFDHESDLVWMAEAESESTVVWSHKQRIAVFLSAMRHFRDELISRKFNVLYHELKHDDDSPRLSDLLLKTIEKEKPKKVIMVRPGEWRVNNGVGKVCKKAKVNLEMRVDRHFLSSVDDFRNHAEGRKELRMEYFYREMRKRYSILMDDDGKPIGGGWNFDKENRKSFGKRGPENVISPKRFIPNKITKEVLDLVEKHFPDHPGLIDSFGWPVTANQAEEALLDFIENRLPEFGAHQDAMWESEPYLNHSLLSVALNLKLISPLTVIKAAEKAYHKGKASIASVEGFIRQVLGWREYVRGVYWMNMPEYVDRNHLGTDGKLPKFFWDGNTDYECLKVTINQTLENGYAHHIQRLMVTGLFTLMLGVNPKKVHEWYLAIYVDAVEWVELPNTLGMSQYADGGVMASKPYCATGNYINRMSNYCSACPKNPKLKYGDEACPFTTLYWDFLINNEVDLRSNHRMGFQIRNLDRLVDSEIEKISKQADHIRKSVA